jgi:ribonuclease J
MPEQKLRLIPLGGCGEIGMNMTVLQVDDKNYFIDCGLLFPDAGLPGVEIILPEISWLEDEGVKPEAWLITHGHEDHIGALTYHYPKFSVPIYASELTLEFIKGKFLEAGISNAIFHLWVPGQTVAFRNMKLTPFTVNHSIAHSLGFFIETKHGNILHTGDFRIDHKPPEGSRTHENIAQVVGRKKVQLMMSDSTNSFAVGTDKSESDLPAGFERIFADSQGAVVFTAFASNIWRYQSVVDAALAQGRRLYLLGRSMLRNFEIAERLGLVKCPPGFIVEDDAVTRVPRRQLAVLCTGSQGEPFSGASRLAFNMHDRLKLDANDTVVLSARAIPGNERVIGQLINQFSRLGCRIVTSKEADVHVSGHGYQEDLKACIRAARPKHFMPVHGEYRHLKKHIELAVECGVPPENCFLAENGDVVDVGPDAHGVIDRVTAGRDFVLQGGVVNSLSDVYRTRLGLAKNGLICVSFVLKERGYDLACRPQLVNKGVPVPDDDILKRMPQALEKAVSALTKDGGRKDAPKLEALTEELRLQVRRAIESRTSYKCIVSVLVSRVGA